MSDRSGVGASDTLVCIHRHTRDTAHTRDTGHATDEGTISRYSKVVYTCARFMVGRHIISFFVYLH